MTDMNVVRLFPEMKGERNDETEAVGKRRSSGERHSPTSPLGFRPLTPVEVLARAAEGRRDGRLFGAPRTPAAVIARSLDRPRGLDAFWAIWMAHQNALRSRSLRLSGGNQADAEDALSAAMVRAAQAFGRQPVHNPGAWLVRILHNTCMDQHRRNAHRVPIDTDDADLPQPSAAAWVKEAPSPEEALSQQESDAAWGRAMGALPASLVEPLRLHLDDWSDERIAAHLNISRELVRKRRQLARNRLRLLLDL